jgi:hypothetical protein
MDSSGKCLDWDDFDFTLLGWNMIGEYATIVLIDSKLTMIADL